jgi:putative transposase
MKIEIDFSIFYSPTSEQWRRHYNTVRPHSALNYRPPAPEAIVPNTGAAHLRLAA